jgi:transcriptional regulator GlxA family with amidase domain
MTHVSILVPEACTLLNSVERVYHIFNQANVYLAEKGEEPVFELHLAGAGNRAGMYGGYSVKTDLLLTDNADTGLIIVPSLAGDIAAGIKRNAVFIPWINAQYRKGAVIAGLCTGCFLLEGTDFINDHNCVMDWFIDPAFRQQFAQVNKLATNIITDERAIHSDGAAYSFIHLLLQTLAGHAAAASCATLFEDEFNRECQSVVSTRNKQTGKPVINQSGTVKNAGKKIKHRSFAALFELQSDGTDVKPQLIRGSNNYRNSKIIKQILQKSAQQNNERSVLH